MLLTLTKPPSSCVKGRQKLLLSQPMIQILNKIVHIKHSVLCLAHSEHLQPGLWTQLVPESQGSWLARGSLPFSALLHCKIQQHRMQHIDAKEHLQQTQAPGFHDKGYQLAQHPGRQRGPSALSGSHADSSLGGSPPWGLSRRRKGQRRVLGVQQPIPGDVKGQP